jgi:putative hydrolase of the HAD superfamily
MASGPAAILFDATGTLIALREPAGQTYARVAAACGLAIPAERLADALARGLARAPSMVFPRARPEEIAGLERDWWRAIVDAALETAGAATTTTQRAECFERLFPSFADAERWIAAPGAREALAALRAAGLATGVVSNFDARLHAILAGLDLAPWLDLVVLPGEARAAKPDPAIFAFALAKLGIEPARAVFVGDDRRCDIAGARAAGMHAIDVSSLATLAALPDHIGVAAARSTRR